MGELEEVKISAALAEALMGEPVLNTSLGEPVLNTSMGEPVTQQSRKGSLYSTIEKGEPLLKFVTFGSRRTTKIAKAKFSKPLPNLSVLWAGTEGKKTIIYRVFS